MFDTSSLIAGSVSILGWLVETTIVATILFGAAWLFCRTRKIGPAARHVLWLVVLIKMLAPPLVHWPWSRSYDVHASSKPQPQLEATLDKEETQAVGAKVESLQPVDMEASNELANEEGQSGSDAEAAVESETPSEYEVVSTAPMEDEAPIEQDSTDESASNQTEQAAPSAFWSAAERLRSSVDVRSLGQLLALIWAFGTFVFGARQLLKILSFELRLRNAYSAPEWLEAEAQAVGERLGVRVPEIVAIEGKGTPLVWCLGEPKLVVPEDLLKSLDASSWRGILAHELAHIKRKDHWIRRAELVGGFIWWWCPLYWAVVRRLEAESELACDAWVVWALPEDRIPYAESLFQVCTSLSDSTAHTPTPALGVAGAGLFFERRLTMILRESISRRPTAASLLAAAVLALLALPSWSRATLAPSGGEAVLHANFRAEQEKPEPPETPEPQVEKKVEKHVEIIIDSDDDEDDADDGEEGDDDKDDVKVKKPIKIEDKVFKRKFVDDEKVAKDAEALSEKLTKKLEKQLGPDSPFAKKMESLGKDLEKKFGEDSEFNKKIESLGAEIEKQFGEDSEFAKKIEELGKELEKKFGGEFTEDIEKMVKDVEKEFGPGSNFEKEIANLAKEIAESVTLKLKVDVDQAEVRDDKAVIIKDKLKKLGAIQADQARGAERAQKLKAAAAERAAKRRADREAAVADRDKALAKKAKQRAEDLARVAVKLKKDQEAKAEAAAKPRKTSSRIQAIEKQIQQLSRELEMLKEQGGEEEDEPDDGDDS